LPRRSNNLTAWSASQVADDRRFNVKSRHSRYLLASGSNALNVIIFVRSAGGKRR